MNLYTMISGSLPTSVLTQKRILKFWLPLASTWLMMAFEGPFLAAIIARMVDAKINLAAYGVAYALALIIEAPVIMLMSASTALVKDYSSFLKLRKFTHLLNFAITIIMAILLIPEFFYYLMQSVVGLPEHISDLTFWATLVLLPWPAAIGYRRFYQGVLIRNNKTRRVAYATLVRLIFMSLAAIILYIYNRFSGAVIGGIALSAGVLAEAIAIRLMVQSSLLRMRLAKGGGDKSNQLSYKNIMIFYYPLALTSLISLAIQPLITFFMGKSRMPIESLAVLPVINSMVFIFRSVGLSYQEVVITFLQENRRNFSALSRFAWVIALVVTLLITLIAFTPLSHFYFSVLSGLKTQLARFALLPTQLLVLIPAFSLLLSFQRGLLVFQKRTQPVTVATLLEVFGIFLILLLSIHYFNWVGAVSAAVALLIGRLVSVTYLSIKIKFGKI